MATVPDFKREGEWVRSFRLKGVKTNTVSGSVWSDIDARLKKPAYVGVTNEFADFQAFANWYTIQPGYGLGWELDKDLLGGRCYSPTNCVLLPKPLNNAIRYKNTRNPELPPGVGQNGNGYRAYTCREYVYKHLGQFATPEAAFAVYKQDKEQYVRELAEQYKDVLDCRTYEALMKFNVALPTN